MVHRLDIYYWNAYNDQRITMPEAKEWIAEAKQVKGPGGDLVMWESLDRYADAFEPEVKAEVEKYLGARLRNRAENPSFMDRVRGSLFGGSDTDGDGVSDKQELKLHTNPYRQDTDGDGFTDAHELHRGSDPGKLW